MCPAFIDVRIPRDTTHLSQQNSVKKPIAGSSKEFNMTRKIDAKNTFDLKQRKTKTFRNEVMVTDVKKERKPDLLETE